MSKRGYYRTVIDKSLKYYICVVCGEMHLYAPTAKNCCLDKKPAYSIDETRAIAESLPALQEHLKNTKEVKKPGEKTRWGHRARTARPNLFDEYHRAFECIEKKQRYQELNHLEKLFGSSAEDDRWTKELYRWYHGKPARTPLQHLAWAFYNHNWEQVKAAAYGLAAEYLAGSEFGDKVHELLLREAQKEKRK